MTCWFPHNHMHCMLSSELPLFGSHLQVDEQFRQLMAATEADSLVVRFAEMPRIQVRGVEQSIAHAVPLHPSDWARWALWSSSSTMMGMRCAWD